MKILPLLIITLLSNCSTRKEHKQDDFEQTTMDEQKQYSHEFENAHPVAKELMNEDFYYSPIDQNSPFGSDDAADAYVGFVVWRKSNPNISPGKYLRKQLADWNYPGFDLTQTDIESLKPYLTKSQMHSRYLLGTDQSILAIAFGQLYLEGKVETEMLELGDFALQRDLTSKMIRVWPEDEQEERKMKLAKMLEVINKLK